MTSSLTDSRRVVLITGASSGLGAGMAREFAARGYDLALCARRLEPMEELRAELQARHPDIRTELACLDVTDFTEVHRVFGDFHRRFGRLDKVVVNAGIGSGVPIGKGGMDANIKVIETNFTAALAQSEAAMEIFREANRGHLVFISSMSAMRGLRGMMTSYSASKAGVATLAEGLHVEVRRKKGIDVTTIFPGYIATEINANVAKSRTPFIIDAKKGCRLMVEAIERRPVKAYVPWWPWAPLGWIMRNAPLWLVTKLT